MSPVQEKRLLQFAIVIGGAFSLFFAAASVVRGVDVLMAGRHNANLNLDSHFRYLSGIFLGVIIAFYTCIPAIERQTARFRLIGMLVICGGAARLLGILTVGLPGRGHIFGVTMELVVTPLLILWQGHLARRFAGAEVGATH